MKMKIAGYVLIAIGISGLVFSLAADLLGFGKGNVSAAQLLGVNIGVAVALIGAAVLVAQKNNSKMQIPAYARAFFDFVEAQPVVVFVVAGFLVGYFLFFIPPMFFNSRLQFGYFERYLPDNIQLGLDTRTIMKYVEGWVTSGQSPISNNDVPYPPLFNILFAPFVLIGFPAYYFLITAISMVSYFLLTLIIPAMIPIKKGFPLLLFFFLTGLFSYGWQFELERGQFNIIVVMMAVFAIYIFHYHKAYRYFAYLFFSIAVQLKIYPFIFIVMFISDWRNWKENILRMIGLCLFNFALLFVLGYDIFISFIKEIALLADQSHSWIGNHSVGAFTYNFSQNGFGLIQGSALLWLQQNAELVKILLFAYFAICFLAIIAVTYIRKEKGFNAALLLACAIGAMVIPTLSYDYKLAILAAPMSIAFNSIQVTQDRAKRIASFLLIFLASLAYTTTMYPFKYRPLFLVNSMPFLFVILTANIILHFINQKSVKEIPQDA